MKSYFKPIIISTIILAASSLLLSQGSGTPRVLRVKVDANGYLLAAGAAQTNPVTTVTFNNARLRTDSSGNLLVATTAGTWSGLQTFPDGIAVTGTFTTSVNGIAITSTDGSVLQNATASTAIIPVQQSPRFRLRSNVWNTTSTAINNTDDWFIESVPVSATTPSGLLKFGSSLNGAAATFPATLTSGGSFTTKSGGSVISGNNVTFAGALVGPSSKTIINGVTQPTATGSFGTNSSVTSSNGTVAFTINVGTGGTASTGTITFPAAITGWVVDCHDITTPASYVTEQTGGSTTNATVTNYSRTLGTAVAWTSGDVLRCTAIGY